MSVALVTGGSRGIGRAIVEAFAAAGYKVGFTYAGNQAAAESLAAAVAGRQGAAIAYQADARDYARAAEVVELVQQQLGPLDVLVNNAGITRDSAFFRMEPDGWQDVIDTNLGGVFNYSRAAVKRLMRASGSIVNITSVAGIAGIAGQVNYSASKAGIIGFTRALAREVARFGLRVNAIAPGYIETDMTTAIDEKVREKLYAQIPLGKPGSAADVARLALYLAGPDSTYVTGQVWTMDGGLT
jgi:3-oxoacyl-[acyl-carrier protein] reductase